MSGDRAVLIVDDEPGIREMIAQALTRLVPESCPLTAASAAEALLTLRERRVEIVISDHRMPGMTGLDLLVEVRKAHPGVHRVLMTAFADKPLVERSVSEAALEHFLSKPFRTSDVAMLVRRLLRADARADDGATLARAFHERNERYAMGLRDVAASE